MAKLLEALSGRVEDEARELVSKLEELSGFPSEDVRFLAELSLGRRQKIARLGLDPDDTTAEELYQALLARYAHDARAVDRAVGVSTQANLSVRAAKAAELARHALASNEVWALKNPPARDVIRHSPPKKLMKKLHYRTVESMLKREDVAAIFIAADQLEALTWHNKVEAALARLGTANYELRPVKTAALPVRLADYRAPEPVTANGAVGAVGVWPASLPPDAPVLSIALLLLDGIENLSEQTVGHSLHTVHPTLNFWRGTEHLLHLDGEQAVSMNFKDTALNHLLGEDYEQHSRANAHQHLWAQLVTRYKNYIDELPQEVATSQTNLNKTFQPALQLVPELAEI